MSNNIPLYNQPIPGTGLNFTPENFEPWLDYVVPILNVLGIGGGVLDGLSSGYGRIAGADYFTTDSTKPRVPSSPSLNIEILNGSWFVQGHLIEIDEAGGFALLGPIPANLTAKYGYASAVEIEDSGGVHGLEILPENWYSTLQPQLSAAGLACIGRVTSDTDSVNLIEPIGADVIVPNTVIAKFVLGLIGGEGEGDGGVALTEALNRIKALEESQAAQDARLANLENQLGGTADFPTYEDQLADEIAVNRAGLSEVNPPAIERGQISVITAKAGHGQYDTPDYSPTTGDANELAFDIATGTFGP